MILFFCLFYSVQCCFVLMRCCCCYLCRLALWTCVVMALRARPYMSVYAIFSSLYVVFIRSFRLSLSRKSKSLASTENGYIWRVLLCTVWIWMCDIMCVMCMGLMYMCTRLKTTQRNARTKEMLSVCSFCSYQFDFVIFIRSHEVHNQWTHIINMSAIFSWYQCLTRTKFTTTESYDWYASAPRPVRRPTSKSSSRRSSTCNKVASLCAKMNTDIHRWTKYCKDLKFGKFIGCAETKWWFRCMSV